jgi:lysyl-tRNA synthetase class 2
MKLGYKTVAELNDVKAGKLFNDLCGINKKDKFGLKNPTPDEVKNWCE